jgi:hypothetical protein
MWQGPFYFHGPPTIQGCSAIQDCVKLLSIAVLLVAAAGMATATPIQPDIKKLLSTPRPTQHFAPARVGWNGPEVAKVSTEALPAAHFGALGVQRDVRPTWVQLITPDWRVFLALGALILLLRQLRKRSIPAPAHAVYTIPVDVGEAEVRRPAA